MAGAGGGQPLKRDMRGEMDGGRRRTGGLLARKKTCKAEDAQTPTNIPEVQSADADAFY